MTAGSPLPGIEYAAIPQRRAEGAGQRTPPRRARTRPPPHPSSSVCGSASCDAELRASARFAIRRMNGEHPALRDTLSSGRIVGEVLAGRVGHRGDVALLLFTSAPLWAPLLALLLLSWAASAKSLARCVLQLVGPGGRSLRACASWGGVAIIANRCFRGIMKRAGRGAASARAARGLSAAAEATGARRRRAGIALPPGSQHVDRQTAFGRRARPPIATHLLWATRIFRIC